MKRLFGLIVLCAIYIVSTAYAVEYPQFNSAVSTTGITANFDTLYSKANQLKVIHDIVDHDTAKIVWKYKDTGNWAIIDDDGTIAIASTSAFSLDIKNVLLDDLTRAKDLIKSIGGSVSTAPIFYYVADPYLYRYLTYDYGNDFDLQLSVPECTINKAKLSISGSDDSVYNTCNNELTVPGQHYYIDGAEVSGCSAAECDEGGDIAPRGVSCVPATCRDPSMMRCGSPDKIYVSVVPVDITEKITPGIHRIWTNGISEPHTMTIEAVTSYATDEILLFPSDYSWTINESRSRNMSELYTLILPTTMSTSTTNATQQ